MDVINGVKVRIGLTSYSQGDKVMDTVTDGTLIKRGSLIRIEYKGANDMPKGKTTVTVNAENGGMIRIKRDGESPLSISAEDGVGSVEIGYMGCYTINGRVKDLAVRVIFDDNDRIFEVGISYTMNAGGVANKIKQNIKVFYGGEEL